MNFIDWAKTVDWQKINDVCDSLSDLNESQFRFLKGRFIELLLEHFSDGTLTYVGEKHKDFYCKKFNCTVELKSEFSTKLYYSKWDSLKLETSVIFSNTMGNHNNRNIDPSFVTDYLIIIKSDGAILVEKENILKNLWQRDDGYKLYLGPKDVVELSGRLKKKESYKLNLKEQIDNFLRLTIQEIDTLKE